MDLHPDEKIVFQGHPSWRSTLTFYLKGLLVALGAAGIAALITTATDEVSWATAALAGLAVFAVAVLIGFLVRLTTTYTITNQRLRIRRGILTKHVQQTKLERVQNVNTHQTVLDRLFRVGEVDFDTAGTEDSDFSFRGVNAPERVVAAVERAQREATDAGTIPDRPAL